MDSTKPQFLEPFDLDFGARKVRVEAGELDSKNLATAKYYPNRRIILDLDSIGPENLMATLWHECLHHIDELFLGDFLESGDKDHHKLDTLANCIDMLLTHSWSKFRELYDAKTSKGEDSSEPN